MIKALVVDDDVLTQRMLSRILGSREIEVECASDAETAIERVKCGSFDVIISDISLPGMNGLELLRAVREHDLDVPVIVMTGDPSIDTAMRALEYGAMRYFTKPVDVTGLVETVQQAARLHQMARLKREAIELLGEGQKLLGDRASLEVRFAMALDKLWIAFQPIVSWSQKSVFGYEALLRSDEPTLPNPLSMIEAAERLRSVHKMGRVVRRRIAEAASGLPEGAQLFVNLHPTDLLDDELLAPSSPLSAYASRVVLELTERASIDGIKDLDGRVRTLRSMGFRLAVDDLGAGYAGLTSLTRLSPEVVKLDMSLTRDVDSSPSKQRVIRSMKKLCDELETTVITEGVETARERDTLEALGCDLLQGYLFAKPTRGFPMPKW